MKKVKWPQFRLQDNKLLRPFQVRDQENRTLLGRARGLLTLSLVAVGLWLVVQNRQLNLLINRDWVDRVSNTVVESFYPTYDSAYFWLNYQGNLAEQLAEVMGANAANRLERVENWVRDLSGKLGQNPQIEAIQLGISGTSEQWQGNPGENGEWRVSNGVNAEFSSWLVSQELAPDQIHWAESRLEMGQKLLLFWLHVNEAGEKIYFLIRVPFAYQEKLQTAGLTNLPGAAIFLTQWQQQQIYPLESMMSETDVASQSAQLASERAALQVEPPRRNWSFLAVENLLPQYLEGKRQIFDASLGQERFWVKITPVQTQTVYQWLAVVLAEKETTLTFGLPLRVVMILMVAFLLANLVIFFYYYWQFSRRYYFTNQIKDIIKDGENSLLEFKSSLRFDYKLQALNKVLEMVTLKSIAAFNNTDGGMIIIGLNDKGKVLGLKNDYETLKKPDKDGFELHLRALIAQAYGEHFAARRLEILFPVLERQEVCVVRIKKGRAAIYTTVTDKNGGKSEKFYIRLGNSSKEIEKPSDIVAYQKERFGWRLIWKLGKK